MNFVIIYFLVLKQKILLNFLPVVEQESSDELSNNLQHLLCLPATMQRVVE